jgi:hypothetical protein
MYLIQSKSTLIASFSLQDPKLTDLNKGATLIRVDWTTRLLRWLLSGNTRLDMMMRLVDFFPVDLYTR